MKLSSKDVALVAIFAALSAIVIKILPGIPIIGMADSNIKFDAVLAPIYGLIIGPYLGCLAALIGGLITAGSPFSILTSFAPAASALVAGLLTQRNIGNGESRVKGWMAAAGVLGLLIIGWYLTDVGQRAPLYPVLHIAGLVLILATREKIAKAFNEAKLAVESRHIKPAYLLIGIMTVVVAYLFTRPYAADIEFLPYLAWPLFFIGGITIIYALLGLGKSSFAMSVAVATYCGIIADHMVGNLAFICSLNIFIPLSWLEENTLQPLGLPDVPSLFMYLIPVSAIERILFTVIATIIGVGLVLAVKRAGLLTRKT